MTDLQAVLGVLQMHKIDSFIERRREIALLYNELLEDETGMKTPFQLENTKSGWHLYSIQLDGNVLSKTLKEVLEEMRALNIGVHVHYIPVYWHLYYQEMGYEKGNCPKVEKWYEQALTLPLFPGMTNEDVIEVVKPLKTVIN